MQRKLDSPELEVVDEYTWRHSLLPHATEDQKCMPANQIIVLFILVLIIRIR